MIHHASYGGSDEETALLASPDYADVRRRNQGRNDDAERWNGGTYPMAAAANGGGDANRRTYGAQRGGVNGCLLILLLAVTIGMSVYFQLELRDLSIQLAEEREYSDRLDQWLDKHERVIQRFNASITNTDVVAKLESLEKSLNQATDRVEEELVQTKKEVTKQLDSTLDELSDTVAQAKKDIEDEVEKVKADVEQYVLTTQDQFSMENSFMVYQLAGTFTLLTCLISMWHMTAHLRKMNEPDVQRKILAILWMSPIYAVTSWFSLVFHSAEGWLAIIKDGYESYVIYQFLAFCIAVIGKGDRSTVVDHLSKHAEHLTPPFRLFGCFEICGCCVPEPYEDNRALADAILTQCQAFALQFVLFRPLTTIGVVVCGQLGYYGAGDGPTDYRSPQFWFTVIQNISIFTAFAGLLKFYHAVDTELAWCRPFAKFLCIKGVVFMTFWQGLAIATVATMTDAGGDDADEWAKSAQNFLICIEMLAFSIAHFYCFPTDEWQQGYRVQQSQGTFGDSIALNDFFKDVRLILSSSGSTDTSKSKGSKKLNAICNEVIPEGDEQQDYMADASPCTQVTANGSDSHDDDTVAVSVSTSEENPRLALARALEESLGIAGDDPDIIEAKERLLASNILRPDFFDDLGDEGLGASFWKETDNIDSSIESNHLACTSTPYVATGVGIGVNALDTPLQESSSDASDEDVDESHDIQEDEQLRPSIFTKVASIAESERRRARRREEKRRMKQALK